MARRKPYSRNISGILLLDKPRGMTSNAVLQVIKRLYKARKAGHTGSLDPLATGMLPICLGEATKVSSFLLDADKRYEMTCRLGVTTTTADAEGEVLEERQVPEINNAQLSDILSKFTGKIEQIPPMYSALKHEGERLYKLAREGKEVERKPRPVEIYSLQMIDFNGRDLDLSVHCSKGTYVRTLAEDIGEALGCGAHVTDLRRTAVGPFQDASAMITLATLEQEGEIRDHFQTLDAHLLAPETALTQWPQVDLSGDMAFYVRQGQAVQVPQAPTSGWVRLYAGEERQFLGMGEIQDDGRVAPRRLFAS